MKIGSQEISLRHNTKVIGEIGINHGGSLMIAKDLADSLARTGIKLFKHQTHIPSAEMSHHAKSTIPGNSDKSIYKIMQECSLSHAEELELAEYVKSKGMVFFSSPFSLEAFHRLLDIGVEGVKIGSGECNNLPLLKKIAKSKLPVIMSTGMNDIQSIKTSVRTLFDNGCVDVALMHTTNLYPTPDRLVRLGGLNELMHEFPDLPVGLSDHTLDNLASIAAATMGASLIERHFTDSYRRNGPDIINSMDENQAAELMASLDRLSLMKGGKREAASEEKVTIDFAFSSVVTLNRISSGEKLTEKNCWIKRPGTGEIPASDFDKILGKVAKKDLEADEQLKWSDFQ